MEVGPIHMFTNLVFPRVEVACPHQGLEGQPDSSGGWNHRGLAKAERFEACGTLVSRINHAMAGARASPFQPARIY